MKTTYLQRQHEKALKIIEMINYNRVRLNATIEIMQKNESLGSNAWWNFPFTDLDRKKQKLLSYREVDARLIAYYNNTLENIKKHAP